MDAQINQNVINEAGAPINVASTAQAAHGGTLTPVGDLALSVSQRASGGITPVGPLSRFPLISRLTRRGKQ